MKYFKKFEQFVNESSETGDYKTGDYDTSDIVGSGNFVGEDWDEKYNRAHESPLKDKIKESLVQVFKDKNVMGLVGDNFYWSDGSNGMMNFNNLNHYITDIGYKCYADEGDEIFEDLESLKKHILYAYASSTKSRVYDDFVNREYDPTDDFSW